MLVSTRRCRHSIYMYMLFHNRIVLILHLHIDAFQALSRRFYHTLQTSVASLGPIFPRLLWLAPASWHPPPLYAKAQLNQQYIAEGETTSWSSLRPTRQFWVAVSIPRRIWIERKEGHSRTFSARSLVPLCPGFRINRVFTGYRRLLPKPTAGQHDFVTLLIMVDIL